jgi:peptide/nickel transport system substrate-binding protein
MATLRRSVLVAVAALVITAAAVAWFAVGSRPPSSDPSPRATLLVATLRTEPTSFNRYSGPAFPTLVVTYLTQASLVRVNRVTDQVEPWLAESWQASADGRSFDVRLREGVRFSDGVPFTAADVEFSLQAAYDPRNPGPLNDALRINGQPVGVEVHSPTRLTLRFPTTYGPGLRVLDVLPMYPKHKLARFLADGSLGKAMSSTAPPEELVGLGPFKLERYDSGERLVFVRNPHYWRRDTDGRPLPKLDRVAMQIVSDQNAELLRFQSGQTDLMQGEIRPEDYALLKAAADQGRIRLLDVGLSLDTHMLWFNLSPAASRGGRGWWLREDFRRAISRAVDRTQFAETVYLGGEPAWNLVSPANRVWYSEDIPRPHFDQAEARRLLAGMGLADRDGDGILQDASGTPVRFTILVQSGITDAEKGAAFLRDALAKVGIGVDVAALELNALIGRWAKSDYDAVFHIMLFTDTDPAGNTDFWLSSGSSHMWNPQQQQPATDWERQVDDLMRRQVALTDLSERRRLFAEVQRVVAEHNPALVFAVPRTFVGASTRLSGLTPAVRRPQILWNPDVIAIQ